MGGWTYAVDFPAEYYPKKGFTSCVRRRKWIRHRRYVANNSWSAVSGVTNDTDDDQEPFIDVSVGGQDLPGAKIMNTRLMSGLCHRWRAFKSIY